jgi:hypothetical protein
MSRVAVLHEPCGGSVMRHAAVVVRRIPPSPVAPESVSVAGAARISVDPEPSSLTDAAIESGSPDEATCTRRARICRSSGGVPDITASGSRLEPAWLKEPLGVCTRAATRAETSSTFRCCCCCFCFCFCCMWTGVYGGGT